MSVLALNEDLNSRVKKNNLPEIGKPSKWSGAPWDYVREMPLSVSAYMASYLDAPCQLRGVCKDWEKIADRAYQNLFKQYSDDPRLHLYIKSPLTRFNNTGKECQEIVHNAARWIQSGLYHLANAKYLLRKLQLDTTESMLVLIVPAKTRQFVEVLKVHEEENLIWLFNSIWQAYPPDEDSLKIHFDIVRFRENSAEPDLFLQEKIVLSIRDWMNKSPSELNKVKSLNLSGFLLQGVPKEVGLFKNLEHLNLSHNVLLDFPETVLQCQKLTSLDFSGCCLDFRGLPKEVALFPNLDCLNLSYNRLSEFPEIVLQCKKLKSLNLSGNKLQGLPEKVALLENLERLDLSNNHLSEFPEIILQCKKLKHLKLSGNQFSEASLPYKLGELPDLRFVECGSKDGGELARQLKEKIEGPVKKHKDMLLFSSLFMGGGMMAASLAFSTLFRQATRIAILSSAAAFSLGAAIGMPFIRQRTPLWFSVDRYALGIMAGSSLLINIALGKAIFQNAQKISGTAASLFGYLFSKRSV